MAPIFCMGLSIVAAGFSWLFLANRLPGFALAAITESLCLLIMACVLDYARKGR